MADSEHTLHLIAKLDTSEVKQQIDKLNSSKLQSTSGAAPAKGIAGSSIIGDVAAVVMASQLNKMKSQFQSVTSSMSGFQKNMSSISGSLAKFNDQLAGLVKLVRVHLQGLHGEVSDGTAQFHAAIQGGRYIPPPPEPRKTPREGILRSPSGRSTSARASDSSTRSAGAHMPGWMPNFLAPDYETPKARSKRGAQPWYKKELVKWGAGYAITQLADEIAAAAGQIDHPLAKGISSGADVLQSAIMGAGSGAPAGPLGAAAGFAVGSIIGVVKQIFQTIRQQSEQTLSEVQQNMKIGYQRRQAALADRAAIRSMKTGFAFSKELEAIQAAGLPEAEKTFAMLVNSISQIDAKIQGGKYRSAGELSSLLQQRQDAQQARGVALSRVQELRDQQQAEAEAETRRREAEYERREAEYENQKRLSELRRMSKFKIRISEMAQNGDIQQLRSLYAGFAKHMTAAKDVETWQRASLGMSIVSSGIQQADSLKLKDLQERLAMTTPVDLTPVTSLGQYGYGMGEVNDNIERQMQVWEEQAQLQRDIRDILDSRSFPGVYE